MYKVCLAFFLLVIVFNLKAQVYVADTLESTSFLADSVIYGVAENRTMPVRNSKITDFVIPVSLIASGFALHYIPALDGVDEWARHKGDDIRRTEIENVLLFVPLAGVYGLDWCGVKAQNNFKDRLIVSASSYAIGQGVVQLLKAVTDRERPDNSSFLSFPSGHTATAFMNAHLLMKEYKHISPWIGVSGYAFAATTGYLRIAKNKHWLSDVIAGAGLGLLSVELGYLLLPYLSKTFSFGHKKESLAVAPLLNPDCAGFGLRYSF